LIIFFPLSDFTENQQMIVSESSMLSSSLRREWYTSKSSLAAATADAVHTNPEDPLDTCNLVLLDSLRAALVAPSLQSGGRVKRQRDGDADGSRRPAASGARFSRSSHQAASRASLVHHEDFLTTQNDKEKRTTTQILDDVVLAPTMINHSAHGTSGNAGSGDGLSLQSGGLDSLFDTSPRALLSPCFELEGDDVRLVAAHIKRVDRMESHRSVLEIGNAATETPLTESELMQREMRAAMAVRKTFSRVRK
jgi:hypothetical protein